MGEKLVVAQQWKNADWEVLKQSAEEIITT
jgi:hypothetical protein